MKYPIALRDSTPYFEKYFLLCPDTPDAYVAAFREAQFEALNKQRISTLAAAVLTLVALAAWMAGLVHLVAFLACSGASWALNHWMTQHEQRLLERTFELALRDKDSAFQAYMWQHRNRPR